MKNIPIYLILLFSNTLFSQSITVQADRYLHVFEGAGVSIGLYMGHHWSMNEANRDKAIRLIKVKSIKNQIINHANNSVFQSKK